MAAGEVLKTAPSKIQKTEKDGCVAQGKPVGAEEKKKKKEDEEFPLVVLGYLTKHHIAVGATEDVSAGITRFLLKKTGTCFADGRYTLHGPIDWKACWDTDIIAEIEKHPAWSNIQILLSAFVGRIHKTGHYGSFEVQILVSSIVFWLGIHPNPKQGADYVLKEIDEVLANDDNLRFRLHYHIRLGIPMMFFLRNGEPTVLYNDVDSDSFDQPGGIKDLKAAFPEQMAKLYSA